MRWRVGRVEIEGGMEAEMEGEIDGGMEGNVSDKLPWQHFKDTIVQVGQEIINTVHFLQFRSIPKLGNSWTFIQ